jgi:hypothetical protein
MPTLLPLELDMLRSRSSSSLPVTGPLEPIVVEEWRKLWPDGIRREDYPRAVTLTLGAIERAKSNAAG